MQEVASVVTSCLNLLQHLRGLYSLERALSQTEVRFGWQYAQRHVEQHTTWHCGKSRSIVAFSACAKRVAARPARAQWFCNCQVQAPMVL